MLNTFKSVQKFAVALSLSLGLLMSSFASQAIILEYDYETVDASNNVYLFNFDISDLSSFSESYFEFSIWFDNASGDLGLEDVDIFDYGPSVAINTSLFSGFPIGETTITDMYFEYFPHDISIPESTIVSIFTDGVVDFSALATDAIGGISVLLETTGILPGDLVVQMAGFAEDANFDITDIGPVTGTNNTVIAPPPQLSSPSTAFLFLASMVMLGLRRTLK